MWRVCQHIDQERGCWTCPSFCLDEIGWWCANTQNWQTLNSVNTRSESIFRDHDVVREFSGLHDNFVIVPVDKASTNYTFDIKKRYVDILIKECGLHSHAGNYTYNLTDFLDQYCWTTIIRCHFIWNTDIYGWAWSALHLLDSEDAQKSL